MTWRRRLLASIALVASAMTSARAETHGWMFTFENDAIFNRDEYYTSGIEFSMLRGPGDVPGPIAAGLNSLCGVFGGACSPDLPGSFRVIPFGNLMYTPKDITIAENQPHDRPWAGWTYVGAVREMVDKDDAQRGRLRTFDLRLGIVGPHSRTAEIQEESHQIRGVAQPAGWSNQIGNRAGVMFRYEDKRAIPLSNAPTLYFVPHAGIAIGTVYRYVNAGAFLVFAEPDRPFNFGASHAQLGPSVPHFNDVGRAGSDHGANPSSGRAQSMRETSYFIGIDLRVMQYNLFLEGKSDVRIRPYRFVYDYVAGARHVTASGLILGVSVVQRSDEFEGSGWERFSSFTIGWLLE